MSETEKGPDALIEQRGHTLILTLNRPEARNALSTEMLSIMVDAWDRVDNDPEIRTCILTGAGGYFCAGMDLKGYLRGERPSVEGRGFAGLTEAPPRKPLIAAVEGPAVAGGCEIVLACDLVVASRTARFGLPEVKRGLVATAGGLLRLPH
ncbi:MAG: enoyl-CoA hydratase-related protein, partial [Actinomycetes bacterium]